MVTSAIDRAGSWTTSPAMGAPRREAPERAQALPLQAE
jgi:hypothetical protein